VSYDTTGGGGGSGNYSLVVDIYTMQVTQGLREEFEQDMVTVTTISSEGVSQKKPFNYIEKCYCGRFVLMIGRSSTPKPSSTTPTVFQIEADTVSSVKYDTDSDVDFVDVE